MVQFMNLSRTETSLSHTPAEEQFTYNGVYNAHTRDYAWILAIMKRNCDYICSIRWVATWSPKKKMVALLLWKKVKMLGSHANYVVLGTLLCNDPLVDFLLTTVLVIYWGNYFKNFLIHSWAQQQFIFFSLYSPISCVHTSARRSQYIYTRSHYYCYCHYYLRDSF